MSYEVINVVTIFPLLSAVYYYTERLFVAMEIFSTEISFFIQNLRS